jgi:phosphotransferase system enzyme I (PtsI)
MTKLKRSTERETILQGVPASPGVAIGRAYTPDNATPLVEAAPITEEMIPDHIERFEAAQQELTRQWELLREKEAQEEARDILSAQMEIIADPELSEQILFYIKEKYKTAQQAIKQAFSAYIHLFSKMDGEPIKSRMVDLTDICNRMIEAAGDGEASHVEMKGDILVTDAISPREVIQLSHQNVKALVAEKGGQTSHAAIIARSMGIPAVMGVKGAAQHINGNTTLFVDGKEGIVRINPSDEWYDQAIEDGQAAQALEQRDEICSRPSFTTDGHPFAIRVNVEVPDELHRLEPFHAEGIGLLRTETLFPDQSTTDSVQQQIDFYEAFLQKTDEDPVTIRLFDAGGDKVQQLEMAEDNPFLGWRGIRLLLDERGILRDQLKAVLTAAGRYPGRVKLLIPMVSAVWEVEEVRHEIEACREELAAEGQPVDEAMPLGIMVETPAAALQASHFARKVDFFSIGTNDLTQYLLAVDRGNAFISDRYDQRHPAVWKVIHQLFAAAQSTHTDVEICGELASDPAAAACLTGMGASGLSMTPVNIPPVKKLLTEHSYKRMKKLAEDVLLCAELQDVERLFDAFFN